MKPYLMHTLILGTLLLQFHSAIAQSPIDSLERHNNYIINSTSYQKGVYKSFEEFKYNNPSIVDNYTFDGKKLFLRDESGRLKKVKKKDAWGISDGTKVFVLWHKYNEILEFGRYCYFKSKSVRMVVIMSPAMLPIIFPVWSTEQLIINFNTGKVYVLSPKLLKHILATDDTELLGEFKKESKKRKKLFDYIKRYNDRNTSKIK